MAVTTQIATTTELLLMCEVGGQGGLVLPLGGDGEQDWPSGLRAILYILGLGWCFLGVAIVSDIFMGAIECITSKKTRKYNPETNRFVTCDVWNATVANLTLMALGSSAPEILLSVIELFGNSIYSGDLGPSTIVGSAAFNLLCIIPVCVMAIPDGEIRKIKEIPVYVITAACSVFAYLWLLIILVVSSANVVEPWEGIATFLMFPIFVIMAFAADKGCFSSENKAPVFGRANVVLSAEMTKDELAEMETRIRRDYGPELAEEQVTKILLIECEASKSRAFHRVAATRALCGGKRVGQRSAKVIPMDEDDQKSCAVVDKKAIIEFAVSKYAVLENAGFVRITVQRSGNPDVRAKVHYKTREGSAKASSDYIHVEGGVLTFAPHENEQTIEVYIIDDIAHEDDEDLFLDLYDPASEDGDAIVVLGANATTTVVIIDDDLPGVIAFPEDSLRVKEALEDTEVEILVRRKGGAAGKITCKCRSENGTAFSPHDFDQLEGIVEFDNNETMAKIKVNIKARGRYECCENFRLILSDPTGGAKFDPTCDGGPDSCILTVFIESHQEAKDRVDRIMNTLAVNWGKAKVGHNNWAEQFKAAIYVNGGYDDGEEDNAGPLIQDYVLHAITVPWKMLFAFVPPTDYLGGWVCFLSSLGMIGIVTAIIGDLAALFGCVMGIPDEVTAITLVALGTSLPDTFASRSAATQDPYADASIGNVTGSNCVNVFLGIGLPWMFGALYWRVGGSDQEWNSKYLLDPDIPAEFLGGAFIVKAGNLAFSVIVFSFCALVCIAVLFVRRTLFGGELGGPKVPKIATSVFLVFLWLVYVALSSWKSISSKNA